MRSPHYCSRPADVRLSRTFDLGNATLLAHQVIAVGGAFVVVSVLTTAVVGRLAAGDKLRVTKLCCDVSCYVYLNRVTKVQDK